jgi:cytochrome d ubiquinol oxidase subunit II
LALIALVCVLLLGLLLIDGIALGTGLVLPWVSPAARDELLIRLQPWQAANDRWLLLLLGVAMAAFPLAWSATIGKLYLPMLAVVAGALLRSLALRAGAPHWLYGSASVIGAIGFGLLLSAHFTDQGAGLTYLAFQLLLVVSMMAAFVLLACSWLLVSSTGELAGRLGLLAAGAARWTAAGMVALSLILALANPAVLYRWTHGHHLQVAALWWVVMLAAFVWLDRLLRQAAEVGPTRIALLLTWLLLGLMVAGVIYSTFPFLILDQMTIWDAASPIEPLSWVAISAAVIAAVALLAQLWDYRNLLAGAPPQASQ